MLLINFQEDPELVRRTVRDRGYVAPVLVDRGGDVAGKLYGVWGPPTAYFVDRRGRLLGRVAGARGWGSVAARRFVEALLEVSPR